MSDSPDRPLRRGLTWNVEADPAGLALPRRDTTERREAAEALVATAADWTPSWSVEPTLDFGSSVPLDDEVA
jgi:hypothetical protein